MVYFGSNSLKKLIKKEVSEGSYVYYYTYYYDIIVNDYAFICDAPSGNTLEVYITEEFDKEANKLFNSYIVDSFMTNKIKAKNISIYNKNNIIFIKYNNKRISLKKLGAGVSCKGDIDALILLKEGWRYCPGLGTNVLDRELIVKGGFPYFE